MALNERIGDLKAGWRTLLACTSGVCFGLTGLATFAFGVFVIPLTEAFGWTRGEAAAASSIMLLGNGITAPCVGFAIQRFGARRIAIFSMVAVALGYLALSQMNGALMMYYTIWVVMTLLGGGTGNVAWTRQINLTFDRARGMALGLILAGSASAAIFVPLLCTKVILLYGWRAGYMALTAVILLIPVPILLKWFKDIRGPVQPVATDAAVEAPATGFTLAQAIRRPTYWIQTISFFMVSGAVSFIIVHQVPLLIDRGMSPMEAASLASIYGLAIIVGRLSDGFLVDIFHGPYVGAFMYSVAAVGCLLLLFGGQGTLIATLAVLTFGLAGAAEIHQLAFLTSRYYGMREYGKIYGFQLFSFYIAGALGPLVAGFMFDRFHSYTATLYLATALYIASAFMLLMMGPYPKFASTDGTPEPAHA